MAVAGSLLFAFPAWARAAAVASLFKRKRVSAGRSELTTDRTDVQELRFLLGRVRREVDR